MVSEVRQIDPEVDGPGAIKAARTAWRRRQIINAATDLMEAKGFHEMSVNDLAKHAGVSVGTIYQYLSSKEDILLLVLLDILEEYRRRLPEAMAGTADPIERLIKGFREYCTIIDDRHSGAALAYRESRTLTPSGLDQVKQLEIETNELLASTIRDAISEGQVAEGTDAALLAADLVMLAHMWALKHWYLSSEYTLEKYIISQLDLVLRDNLTAESRARYRQLTETS